MARDVTTIEVGVDTWSGLNRLKAPGDSFDVVLRRLLTLAGDDTIDPPESDDEYITGEVILTLSGRETDEPVLKPGLIVRNESPDDPGDVEVAHVTDLTWETPEIGAKPRARGRLRDSATTHTYPADTIVELADVRYIRVA